MGKIRKGRVAGVVLVLGGLAWGAATLIPGEASVETAAEQPALVEAAPEPAPQPTSEPIARRTEAAATAWSERTAQVASLLHEFPLLTVHRMKTYSNGTLRLTCSASGSNLREVARIRDGVKTRPLGSSSTLTSSSVQIATHGVCSQHGDVGEIMLFTLDLAPTEPVPPDSVDPGSLQLVARCTATD